MQGVHFDPTISLSAIIGATTTTLGGLAAAIYFAGQLRANFNNVIAELKGVKLTVRHHGDVLTQHGERLAKVEGEVAAKQCPLEKPFPSPRMSSLVQVVPAGRGGD